MRFDLNDLGFAVLLSCFGAVLVIDHINDAERRTACDKRGGALVKIDDSWSAEKRCVIEPPTAEIGKAMP